MRFPILVRWHLYIEPTPWSRFVCTKHFIHYNVQLSTAILQEKTVDNANPSPVDCSTSAMRNFVGFFVVRFSTKQMIYWSHIFLVYLRWKPDCLFNRLFRIATNPKTMHYWPTVSTIPWWPLDSPHKGPVVRTSVPCHNIIMLLVFYMAVWSISHWEFGIILLWRNNAKLSHMLYSSSPLHQILNTNIKTWLHNWPVWNLVLNI